MIEKEQALHALDQMLLIRNFEQRGEQAYQLGKVWGFYHAYIGQEAIQTAAVTLLGTKDHLWARKYRPDLPKHPLQYLREIYGIEANQAHRALDDVIVLHKLFSLMIEDLPIEEVYRLLYQDTGNELLRQMPFGKHRGEPLNALPKHYIKWLAQSGAFDKPDNDLLKRSLEKLNLL